MTLPDGRLIVEIDKAGSEQRLVPRKIQPAQLMHRGGPQDGKITVSDITLVPEQRNVTSTLIPARVYLRLPSGLAIADLVGTDFTLKLMTEGQQ